MHIQIPNSAGRAVLAVALLAVVNALPEPRRHAQVAVENMGPDCDVLQIVDVSQFCDSSSALSCDPVTVEGEPRNGLPCANLLLKVLTKCHLPHLQRLSTVCDNTVCWTGGSKGQGKYICDSAKAPLSAVPDTSTVGHTQALSLAPTAAPATLQIGDVCYSQNGNGPSGTVDLRTACPPSSMCTPSRRLRRLFNGVDLNGLAPADTTRTPTAMPTAPLQQAPWVCSSISS